MTTFLLGFAPDRARALGRLYAAELNRTPSELQNWSPLRSASDIPDAEAGTLISLLNDVYDGPYPAEALPQVEAAYLRGFNETLETDGTV